MAAFASGQEINRIPVTAFIGEHSCRLTGVQVSEYHNSVEVMVDAEIQCTMAASILTIIPALILYYLGQNYFFKVLVF